MTNDTKNVFISHIHEDDEGLKDLKSLLKNNGLTIRDYSINADNPNRAHSAEYIKSHILAPRIRQSSTIVVYISRETKDSEWVDWEIAYAEKHGKRIVGVWALGENGCEVPEALDQYADAVVGWRGNRIIEALNGQIIAWQQPDGETIEPRNIQRHSCA